MVLTIRKAGSLHSPKVTAGRSPCQMALFILVQKVRDGSRLALSAAALKSINPHPRAFHVPGVDWHP